MGRYYEQQHDYVKTNGLGVGEVSERHVTTQAQPRVLVWLRNVGGTGALNLPPVWTVCIKERNLVKWTYFFEYYTSVKQNHIR